MSAILNRQAFLDRIETSVEEHAGAQASFVVLLVGIRGLHNFNVQLGYQTVDELLGRIPGLMRQKLPKANCIERIGDTCFAAIIPNVFATNLVELALERVANAVCGPFDIGERDSLSYYLTHVVVALSVAPIWLSFFAKGPLEWVVHEIATGIGRAVVPPEPKQPVGG